jgi:hypothetical protein
MKRAGILGLAIVLTLGLAVSASQAAKAKKVASEVEVDGYYPPPDYEFAFVGDVFARQNKCERNRTVTLYYDESGKAENVGVDVTDRTGDWTIAPNLIGSDDPFYAVVDRKVVRKGDKKIVCKADTSPRVFVPA